MSMRQWFRGETTPKTETGIRTQFSTPNDVPSGQHQSAYSVNTPARINRQFEQLEKKSPWRALFGPGSGQHDAKSQAELPVASAAQLSRPNHRQSFHGNDESCGGVGMQCEMPDTLEIPDEETDSVNPNLYADLDEIEAAEDNNMRALEVRILEAEWLNNKELRDERHAEMQQLLLSHKARAREEARKLRLELRRMLNEERVALEPTDEYTKQINDLQGELMITTGRYQKQLSDMQVELRQYEEQLEAIRFHFPWPATPSGIDDHKCMRQSTGWSLSESLTDYLLEWKKKRESQEDLKEQELQHVRQEMLDAQKELEQIMLQQEPINRELEHTRKLLQLSQEQEQHLTEQFTKEKEDLVKQQQQQQEILFEAQTMMREVHQIEEEAKRHMDREKALKCEVETLHDELQKAKAVLQHLQPQRMEVDNKQEEQQASQKVPRLRLDTLHTGIGGLKAFENWGDNNQLLHAPRGIAQSAASVDDELPSEREEEFRLLGVLTGEREEMEKGQELLEKELEHARQVLQATQRELEQLKVQQEEAQRHKAMENKELEDTKQDVQRLKEDILALRLKEEERLKERMEEEAKKSIEAERRSQMAKRAIRRMHNHHLARAWNQFVECTHDQPLQATHRELDQLKVKHEEAQKLQEQRQRQEILFEAQKMMREVQQIEEEAKRHMDREKALQCEVGTLHDELQKAKAVLQHLQPQRMEVDNKQEEQQAPQKVPHTPARGRDARVARPLDPRLRLDTLNTGLQDCRKWVENNQHNQHLHNEQLHAPRGIAQSAASVDDDGMLSVLTDEREEMEKGQELLETELEHARQVLQATQKELEQLKVQQQEAQKCKEMEQKELLFHLFEAQKCKEMEQKELEDTKQDVQRLKKDILALRLTEEERLKERMEEEAKKKVEAERRSHMAKRVIRRMHNHHLARAWNQFVECIYDLRRQRTLVKRVAARMTRKQLAVGFECYAVAVGQIVDERECVAKELQRDLEQLKVQQEEAQKVKEMEQKELEDTKQDVQRLKKDILALRLTEEERLKERMEEEAKKKVEAERRSHMAKRVIRRMHNHHLSRAWNQFVECIYDLRRQRTLVKRVAARMTRKQLAVGFECYAVAVGQIVDERERVAKDLVRELEQLQAQQEEVQKVNEMDERGALLQAKEEIEKQYELLQKELGNARQLLQATQSELDETSWRFNKELRKGHEALDELQIQLHAAQCSISELREHNKELSQECEKLKTESSDLPVAVALKYDIDFDETLSSPEATAKFDAHVQEQVRTALGIPPAAVHVLCHQRGSVIAEVLLKKVDMKGCDGDSRNPALLAQELVEMTKDQDEALCRKEFGDLAVTNVKIDGPISESIFDIFKQTLTEARKSSGEYGKQLRNKVQEIEMLNGLIEHQVMELDGARRSQVEAQEQISALEQELDTAWRMVSKGQETEYGLEMQLHAAQDSISSLSKDLEQTRVDFEAMQTELDDTRQMQRKRYDAQNEQELKLHAAQRSVSQLTKELKERMEEEAKKKVEAERRSHMAKRAIRRMHNHHLSRAWNQFVECIYDRRRQRTLVKRVVARMTRKQLAVGFECYAVAVGQIVDERECVAKEMGQKELEDTKQDVRRLKKDILALRLTEEERLKERMEEEAKKKVEAERRSHMAKRVIRRMHNHHLARAWNQFVECIYDLRRQRTLVKRVAARMTRKQLAVGFECYAVAVGQIVDERERVAKRVARWKTSQLMKTFVMWFDYLENCRKDHSEVARVQLKQQLKEAEEKAQTMMLEVAAALESEVSAKRSHIDMHAQTQELSQEYAVLKELLQRHDTVLQEKAILARDLEDALERHDAVLRETKKLEDALERHDAVLIERAQLCKDLDEMTKMHDTVLKEKEKLRSDLEDRTLQIRSGKEALTMAKASLAISEQDRARLIVQLDEMARQAASQQENLEAERAVREQLERKLYTTSEALQCAEKDAVQKLHEAQVIIDEYKAQLEISAQRANWLQQQVQEVDSKCKTDILEIKKKLNASAERVLVLEKQEESYKILFETYKNQYLDFKKGVRDHAVELEVTISKLERNAEQLRLTESMAAHIRLQLVDAQRNIAEAQSTRNKALDKSMQVEHRLELSERRVLQLESQLLQVEQTQAPEPSFFPKDFPSQTQGPRPSLFRQSIALTPNSKGENGLENCLEETVTALLSLATVPGSESKRKRIVTNEKLSEFESTVATFSSTPTRTGLWPAQRSRTGDGIRGADSARGDQVKVADSSISSSSSSSYEDNSWKCSQKISKAVARSKPADAGFGAGESIFSSTKRKERTATKDAANEAPPAHQHETAEAENRPVNTPAAGHMDTNRKKILVRTNNICKSEPSVMKEKLKKARSTVVAENPGSNKEGKKGLGSEIGERGGCDLDDYAEQENAKFRILTSAFPPSPLKVLKDRLKMQAEERDSKEREERERERVKREAAREAILQRVGLATNLLRTKPH